MSRDFSGLAIKRFQAAIVYYPELSASVLSGGPYIIPCYRCRILWIVRISSGSTADRVKSVEPPGCRQPKHSGAILAELRDRSGQAAWRLGHDVVMGKSVVDRIVFIERLITADPQCPGVVHKETANIDTSQTFGTTWFVLECFGSIAIVAIQSVLRTEPQEAKAVLHYRRNSGLRYTRASGELSEPYVVAVDHRYLERERVATRALHIGCGGHQERMSEK